MPSALRLAVIVSLASVLLLALVLPVAANEPLDGTDTVRAADVVVSDEAWFYRFRAVVPGLPEEVEDPSGGFYDVGRAEVRKWTNPFPLDTLHVGVIGGEPIARTYFGLSTFDVTDEPASIVGGTLRLVDNEEDSLNAAAADMIACPVHEDLVVTDNAGDWDAQPVSDCSVFSDVVLVPDSDPLTWEVDLAPFAEVFADNLAPGVAIMERGVLEDSETPDPAESWHVSFDASTRTEDALAPDSTALIEELERLARVTADVDVLTGLVSDPESIPTFLVVQALPDVNAVWRQSRVARQTDPEREIRPATADLELEVMSLGDFDDVDDVEGAGDFEQLDDGSSSIGGSASSADFSTGTTGTGDTGSASSFDSGAVGSAVDTEVALDLAEAEEPALAAADDESQAAPGTAHVQAAPPAGLVDARTGGPGILLLLPLALSVAGALGWSLTQPAQVEIGRQGGALDRLAARRTTA
jgi:hypothetical protein